MNDHVKPEFAVKLEVSETDELLAHIYDGSELLVVADVTTLTYHGVAMHLLASLPDGASIDLHMKDGTRFRLVVIPEHQLNNVEIVLKSGQFDPAHLKH